MSYTEKSIVYINLMKIFSSKSTLYDKQLAIEKYLNCINKNFYISSKQNQEIDYDLLNSPVFKIIKSKESVFLKLINNYIAVNSLSNLSVGKINQDKVIISNIYKEIGIDYLLNISWGRVIRILSNSYTFNTDTFLANILDELSKDIINRYNYLQYEKNFLSIADSFQQNIIVKRQLENK
uniref:hypothetical protein 10 n=1 Tax=Moniliophthora perniciosa TaxID=153609 RepID=UPI0000242343|nr:hypothetical protein 10 [Moniliophthora perniciosa]AAQ74300.1 hypothetical protein 10 [Moniliophthora perniciosa]